MDLFSRKSKPAVENTEEVDSNRPKGSLRNNESLVPVPLDKEKLTFASLGLTDWICTSVKAMGYKRPTPIQQECIPAILQGRDVIGCAETGSGKTAAFALPILQELSKDIFGIFAIILTPTRELAVQISEQFTAFGTSICLRVCLVIGGVNMVHQGIELHKRPHIVIATPGRLRHHLEGPEPPNIRRTKFLVLDECDRLLAAGFQSELDVILSKINPHRQTLLFSATLTNSLSEVEQFAMTDTLRFDLTVKKRIPENLSQEYLFMPKELKNSFLVTLLRSFQQQKGDKSNVDSDEEEENELLEAILRTSQKVSKKTKKTSSLRSKSSSKRKANASLKKRTDDGNDDEENRFPFSLIIFVGSCKRCQELKEILLELNVDCVGLNSMMSQTDRLRALSRFKSKVSQVLIATDVASRGLDIPSVDVIINFDLPKVLADYVHRIGRTARAGRAGRAISFLTPHDITLLHAIEEYTAIKMTECTDIQEQDVIPNLNPVAKATRVAQQNLLERGFDEQVELFQKRKRKQRKHLLRKKARMEHENGDE